MDHHHHHHHPHQPPHPNPYPPPPPPPQPPEVYPNPYPPPPQPPEVYPHHPHPNPYEPPHLHPYPPPPPPPEVYPPPYSHHPHHIPHHDRPFDGPFPPTTVHHVAHETPFYPPHPPPHPDIPRVVLPNGPDVRVFCRADSDLSLTVRDGSVVLAPANHRDPFQHWIKDEKFATRVKDREGLPSFALVNKATGLALQHPIGETQPVRLIPYSAGEFNQTILWTLSKDIKHGFKAIRMASNVRLSLDAFHGDKDHGGVRDGTTIVLWECWKGDNQLWKLVPYCK